MKQKTLLPLLVSILFIVSIIAVLHILGTYFYIYWQLPGFDYVVHLVGGFMVVYTVLGFAYILFKPRVVDIKKSHVVIAGIFAAGFIGLLWELFEVKFGITFSTDANYWFNMAGDLLSGIIGGLCATFYFIKAYNE